MAEVTDAGAIDGVPAHGNASGMMPPNPLKSRNEVRDSSSATVQSADAETMTSTLDGRHNLV